MVIGTALVNNINFKKEINMKLTEKQMIAIIKEKRITNCTKEEKEQVMNFAFGEDYMDSNDKGARKTVEVA